MKLEQIIRERRTIHSYLNEEVPADIIKNALELATYAPNHKLTFPFLFITTGSIAREKISELAVELKGIELVRNKFKNEGSLIFFAQKLVDDDYTRREDYATMACAIQNFSLYMWEQGFGSKWSSGKIISSPKLYEILSIDKNDYEIVGMIWCGKFKSLPKTPHRPNIDKVTKAVP